MPAAPAEAAAVDGDFDPVGVGAVAHPVAALAVDDVHADARSLVDLAGNPADHARRRLGDAHWCRDR